MASGRPDRAKALILVALRHLHLEDGDGAWTAAEIGEAAGLTAGHVGRTCSKLERAGLVRSVEPEMRRVGPRRYALAARPAARS